MEQRVAAEVLLGPNHLSGAHLERASVQPGTVWQTLVYLQACHVRGVVTKPEEAGAQFVGDGPVGHLPKLLAL